MAHHKLLPNNPYNLLNAVRSHPNLKVRDPKWVDALTQFPPSQPPLLKPLLAQRNPVKDKLHRISNPKKAYKPIYLKRPQKIVFPEDKLRKNFYKIHPFELATPVNVSQSEQNLLTTYPLPLEENDRFVSIKHFKIDGTSLTGESVIKYTFYLTKTEKMPKLDAYRKALEQFYSLKAKSEVHQEIKKAKRHKFALENPAAAEDVGITETKLDDRSSISSYSSQSTPLTIDPILKRFTAKFVEYENMALKDSKEFEMDQFEKIEMRKEKAMKFREAELLSISEKAKDE